MQRRGRVAFWVVLLAVAGSVAGVLAGPAETEAAGAAEAAAAGPGAVGAVAQVVGPSFQVPLLEGPGADPTIRYHDPDGAGSAPGYYLMLYNKIGFNDAIVVRKASTLANLRYAPDQEIYRGTAAGHPAALRCGVGQGGWFVPSGGRWYLFGWGDDCTGLDANGDFHAKPFVLESAGSDPLGPYTFKASFDGPVAAHPWGYANAPVTINGQLYVTLAYKDKLYIASMSNPWTMSSAWNVIAQASAGWECPIRCINEGASVVEHGGKAFLVFSAGGYESPDYCVGMLTANMTANPLSQSSWTKSSGCVFARNDAAGVYGPASMNLFSSPDGTETWAGYHVKTATGTGTGGADRVLQAHRVDWNADGTPNFGQPYPLGQYVARPSGEVPVFDGVNTYEAEAGTLTGGATVTTSAFASGGSYVTSLSAGRAVSLPIGSFWARGHRLFLYYANPGAAATVNVRANGGSPTTVSLPTTGSGSAGRFPVERYAVVELPLSATTNTVAVEGATGTVSLDKVAIDLRATAEAPALASRGPTNLDAFTTKPDGTVGTRSSTDSGATWGAWGQPGTDAVPSGPRSQLGAVSRKADWLDLFTVGRDGNVYSKWWQGVSPAGWRNWFSLGAPPPGVGSGGVSAAGRTGNDLDVVVLGADNRVWTKPWHDTADGGIGWGAWTSIGAPPYGAVAAPMVVSRVSTEMRVFVLGADGHVWTMPWTSGGGWGVWSPLGSPPGGAVSALTGASYTDLSIDIVVRSIDGSLWTRRYTAIFGVAWGPWTQIPGSGGNIYNDRGFAAASRHQTTAQTDVISWRPDGQIWRSWRSDTAWQPWTSLAAP